MDSNIYFHSECDFDSNSVSSYLHALTRLIKEEKMNLGVINYIFCDDSYLLEKNQIFLKHNTLTDIITFDYSEKKVLNADIFISIDRVKENAINFVVPFDSELRRVMIHGILHLIGYKDKTDKEKVQMREKEDFYLENMFVNN
ncbi:MAG: rRNA maturation RNase YbeY [Flavobacteriales bacterium]